MHARQRTRDWIKQTQPHDLHFAANVCLRFQLHYPPYQILQDCVRRRAYQSHLVKVLNTFCVDIVVLVVQQFVKSIFQLYILKI